MAVAPNTQFLNTEISVSTTRGVDHHLTLEALFIKEIKQKLQSRHSCLTNFIPAENKTT